MKYIIMGNSVTKRDSIALGFVSNDKDPDYITFKDVITSQELSNFLSEEGFLFTWRIVSQLSQVGGFYVELIPTTKNPDYKILNVENEYLTTSDSIKSILVNEGFDEEFSEKVNSSILNAVNTVVAETNQKTLAVAFTGNNRTYFSEDSAEQDEQVFNAYPKVPLRVCMEREMFNPEDILSFNVPSYTQLKRVYETKEEHENNIKMGNTDNSMDDEDSDTDETEIFNSNLAEVANEKLSYDVIGPNLNKKLIHVDSIFPFYDSVFIETAVQTVGSNALKDIIGHNENNELDIQSNERDYYESLCSLMRNGVRHEQGILSSSMVEKFISEGKTSEIVTQYLQDIAEEAFQLNYRHTGYVVFGEDEDDPDQRILKNSNGEVDDNSNSGDSISYNIPGIYRVVPDGHNGFEARSLTFEHWKQVVDSSEKFYNGFPGILAYVTNFDNKAYAWPELVIKLLRWGKRKPHLLYLKGAEEDSKKVYLSFENMHPTKFNGNFNELTPIVDPRTGCAINLNSIVWGSASFSNPELINSITGLMSIPGEPATVDIPIGVLTYKCFKENSSMMGLEYVDLFTLLKDVKEGTLRISGLSYDKATDNFEIDTGIVPGTDAMEKLAQANARIDKHDESCVVRPNVELLELLNTSKQIFTQDSPSSIGKLSVLNINTRNMFKLVSYLFQADNIEQKMDIANLIEIKDMETRNMQKRELAKGVSEGVIPDASIITWYLVEELAFKYFNLWDAIKTYSDLNSKNIRELNIAEFLNILNKLDYSNVKRDKPIIITPTFKKNYELVKVWHPICAGEKVVGYSGVFTRRLVTGEVSKYIALFACGDIKEHEAPTSDLVNEEPMGMSTFLKFYQVYRQCKVKNLVQANKYILATEDSFENIRKNAEQIKGDN